jgi:hypothetical protein
MTNNASSKGGGDLPSPPPAVARPEPSVETPEVRQQRRNDYNRLVRTARLTSMLLENVDFKTKPESVGTNKSLLSRDLGANAKVLSSGSEDGTCVANIEWTVKYSFKSRAVVRCSASYIVSYEGMKGFSDEVIGIFVDTNSKSITYSYFRALYAHIDWSANLGSAPLPIVQLQAKV